MLTDKTKTIATGHSGDVQRLMDAMGIKDKMVTAFALSVVGPGECITVSVTRYLTEAELAALADELEANPLKAESAPQGTVGVEPENAADDKTLLHEIVALRHELRKDREERAMFCEGGLKIV